MSKSSILRRVVKKLDFSKNQGNISKREQVKRLPKFGWGQDHDGATTPTGVRGHQLAHLAPVRGLERQGMPRIYRNVYVAIWEDDKFPFCSDDCQAVWFHLMTCKYNTPIGFVTESLEGLAAHRGKNGEWTLERYAKAFEEGLAKGFWEADRKHLLIRFPKWFSWNKPANPNVLKSWADFFNQLPACDLKTKAIQELKALLNTLDEAFRKAFAEAFAQPLPKREQNQNQQQKYNKNKDFLSETTFSDEVTNLVNLLCSKMLTNDAKAKCPPLSENGAKDPKWVKWAKEADLLLRVDQRDFKEAEQLIHWCQDHSFWKTNILSMGKFRLQYPQLRLKFKAEQNWQPEQKETEDERRKRLIGG